MRLNQQHTTDKKRTFTTGCRNVSRIIKVCLHLQKDSGMFHKLTALQHQQRHRQADIGQSCSSPAYRMHRHHALLQNIQIQYYHHAGTDRIMSNLIQLQQLTVFHIRNHLLSFPLVLGHSWLGDKHGIRPVNS